MKISIVIPAYNEESRIGKTLEEYSDFFEKKHKSDKIDYEILIVINNTKDHTEEEVKKCKIKNKRIQYINLAKGGKGYAVIEGFKNSLGTGNDILGFVDADMSTSPQEFYKLLDAINGYDGAIASRYIKGAIVKPKQSLSRIIISRAGNFIIRSLFFLPFRDTQCGAKIFKREAIKKIISEVLISQWAFDVELLYKMKKNSLRIIEVPTLWSDKEDSKLRLNRAAPQVFLAVWQLRLENSIFKRLAIPIKPIIKKIWRSLR